MSNQAAMPALGHDDVQRLMRRASGRGHTGSRNRALVAAFAGAGLGVAEALALTPADLGDGARSVRVDGPRPRTVDVEPDVAEALAAWVADREALGVDPAGPLFCTREGLPLEASYVRRLLARLGREAGLGGVVNARGLRESYAARRLAAGASLEHLSRELGHATVASTQRFVRQIGVTEAAPSPSIPADVAEAALDIAHSGITIVHAERDDQGVIRDFTYEYINAAGAALGGRPREEFPGSRVSAMFPNSPSDGTFARWTELIDVQGRAGEPRIVEAEGRTRVYRVRRLALGDRIVMSFEDHSQARVAERALARLDAQHTAVFEATAAGLLIFDTEGAISAANPAAHRILGFPPGGLLGRTPGDPRWEQLDQDGRPLALADQPNHITRTTGQPTRDRVIGVRPPSGRRVWISVATEAVESPRGAPYAVAASLVDLGAQRRAAARVRAAEAAVTLFREATATLLLRCRPDGAVLGAVGPVQDLLGCSPADVEAGLCRDDAVPGDRSILREAYVSAMESPEVVEVKHRMRDRSGEEMYVSRSLLAVRDPLTGDVEEVQSLIRWRP